MATMWQEGCSFSLCRVLSECLVEQFSTCARSAYALVMSNSFEAHASLAARPSSAKGWGFGISRIAEEGLADVV